MAKITFSTQFRKIKGKKVKRLRQELMTPGNIYGVGQESGLIKFLTAEFEKLYQQVGETGLVYLQLEDEEQEKPTLIGEVQRDPVTSQLLHVSFKEVDLKEKIEAQIPIEMEGEFEVKEAVLVQVRSEIEVQALPIDLPEKFMVNIEGLAKVGDMITLADLDFDKSKVSLVEIEVDEDWGKPVVLVQEQREEEMEEEEKELTPEDVEIESEKAEAGSAAGGDEGGKSQTGVEQEVEVENN